MCGNGRSFLGGAHRGSAQHFGRGGSEGSAFEEVGVLRADAKAQFRSVAEPWADTGTSTGRLMIAVLGGLADVERDLIRTRTAEGRSWATKRGQRMGRETEIDRGAASRGP